MTQNHFISHGENYSACENSSIMSAVALEELCQVFFLRKWRRENEEKDGVDQAGKV